MKKRHINIFPLPYNGELSELTWPPVTEIKIPRYKFRYRCPYQLLKVPYWSLKSCSHGDLLHTFWGRVTWPDLVAWPEMTLIWNFSEGCKIDVWKGMQKDGAAPRRRFLLRKKKQLVWSKRLPPRAKVKIVYILLSQSWSGVVVGVGDNNFRPESEPESLKIRRLRSPVHWWTKVSQTNRKFTIQKFRLNQPALQDPGGSSEIARSNNLPRKDPGFTGSSDIFSAWDPKFLEFHNNASASGFRIPRIPRPKWNKGFMFLQNHVSILWIRDPGSLGILAYVCYQRCME